MRLRALRGVAVPVGTGHGAATQAYLRRDQIRTDGQQRNPVIGHGTHQAILQRFGVGGCWWCGGLRLSLAALLFQIRLTAIDGTAQQARGNAFDAPRQIGHFVPDEHHLFQRCAFVDLHQRQQQEEWVRRVRIAWAAPSVAS